MRETLGEIAGEKPHRGKEEDFSSPGALAQVTRRNPGPWPRAAGGRGVLLLLS